MNISHKLAGCSLFFILVTSGSLQGQGKSPQENQKSCRNFMQGFYNKFVQAHKTNKTTSYSFDQTLSPELRRQLKEDKDNNMDDNGYIVGLDFDPIAAGNDICTRYEVGKAWSKGDRYFVEVYCFWVNKKAENQRIVHEVMLSRGRWMIMNIHYYDYEKGKLADHSDLLSILKELGEKRRKPSK